MENQQSDLELVKTALSKLDNIAIVYFPDGGWLVIEKPINKYPTGKNPESLIDWANKIINYEEKTNERR